MWHPSAATEDLLRLCQDALPMPHASASRARHAALTAAIRCLVSYLQCYVLPSSPNRILLVLLSACDKTAPLLGLVRMFFLGNAARCTCLGLCPMKDMMKTASTNAVKLLVNKNAEVTVNFTSKTSSKKLTF